MRFLVGEAVQAAPDETIGYLVGRSFRDEQGYYAIVNSAVVAVHAKRSGTYVETTLEDEISTVLNLAQNFPTCEKIGWWHSHPFALHSYSGTDRENQAFHCSQPFQLGLLVCLVGQEATVHALHGPESQQLANDYKMPLYSQSRLSAAGNSGMGTKAPEVHVVVSPTPPARWLLVFLFVIFGLIWPQILILCTDRIAEALKEMQVQPPAKAPKGAGDAGNE